MSERSPEDPSLSTPDAGGNPQKVQPHLEDVPYAEMTLKEAIDAGLVQPVVDPNTLQQVQEKTYRSERPPAIEPAMDVQPASKNNKLRNGLIALGAGATAIAIAASAWIGLSGEKDDTTPKSETTATAPAQPTSPVETATASAAPGEKQAKPVSEWKFYNADGTFLTAEQVKKSAAVDPNRYPTLEQDLNAAFENLEATINYFPDRKTVLEAYNITEDQLSSDMFFTVAREYQKLSFDTLVRGNGDFRKWLDQVGANAVSDRIQSILDGEKIESHYSLSQDWVKSETVTVSDNSVERGSKREKSAVLGTYKITSISGDDFVALPVPAGVDRSTYVNSRTFDGNIGMTKVK
jgi:hypothetical protein